MKPVKEMEKQDKEKLARMILLLSLHRATKEGKVTNDNLAKMQALQKLLLRKNGAKPKIVFKNELTEAPKRELPFEIDESMYPRPKKDYPQ
ncbi:MAG: hypothetical protein IJF71_05030 [Clostridia bacterium]|nr:hypothetical protein [Clostridia bacterium]